jgi:hypothetical protein
MNTVDLTQAEANLVYINIQNGKEEITASNCRPLPAF